MGSILSTFRSLFVVSQVPIHTLMIGPDTSGKTTIVNYLKLGKAVVSMPVIELNIETITYNNFTLTIWDVCGGGRFPYRWRYYFRDMVGAIFVIDSNDVGMISQAKEHLWRAHNEFNMAGLQRIPLLVYANKQDLQSAMTVAEVRDALDLTAVQGREWHIQGSCALKGEGLKEGLDWYIGQVEEYTRS